MKRWFLIFFMVYCLSILNTPLGNKYRNSFWKRAVYCIIKCYSRCKCSEGLGKMLLTGTAYESMWNCCLPCLPGKSCCCPGVLTESCWVIDGVNHGKASLSAACSRRRVAEVMPSSGHGLGQLCLELSPASVTAAETQRGSSSPREKVEGDGMMTPAGRDLCCPSCCSRTAGLVCLMLIQLRQVRGSRVPEIRCKNHPRWSNKCHELLTSTVSSRAKCNSPFFFNYWN